MLKSLSVANFALIENADVEFATGLNVLTGETGAGKSILIDALNTVLGGRASTDYIRVGCDYFRVEALFDISYCEPVKQLVDQYGIAAEEDGTLIISRRFSVNGKNAILINGSHITLSVLKLFGQRLVDMHGQHDNQALLHPETHLGLLDSFDEAINAEVQQYREIYRRWQQLSEQINNFEELARERVQRLDMLTWQTNEIAAAALRPEEDNELDNQIRVLGNIEKIANSVNKAHLFLNEGSQGNEGVLGPLAEARRELDIAARYDSRLDPQLCSITDLLYQLKELSTDLSVYMDAIDFNPKQLAQLQERMDIIYKLKKKYGSTIEEILTYYQSSLEEITSMNASDEQIARMCDEHKRLEKDLLFIADEIDEQRRRVAESVGKSVCFHLQKLGMPNCKFKMDVIHTEKLNSTGRNEVSILFSANAGEPPKPLHKVVSGGELSRIALALKTVCAHRDKIGSVVFDEIDAGIGGQTALMVGERIAMVACHKQVLCITHSPQIACMADNHIHIEKQVTSDRTKTIITVLSQDDREMELARMIAGNDLTETVVENAIQMINTATIKKEIWKKEAQA